MNEYSVRIVLSELTIVAESPERAEEIAMDILYMDARTHLSHGLGELEELRFYLMPMTDAEFEELVVPLKGQQVYAVHKMK